MPNESTRLLGYADRLSVRVGERVQFMISSPRGTYNATVQRIRSVDDQRGGPGFNSDTLPSPIDGSHAGGLQELGTGSYVVAPAIPELDGSVSFTIAFGVCPTRLDGREQALVARAWQGASVGIFIDGGGRIQLRMAREGDATTVVASRLQLELSAWHRIVVSYEAHTGELALGVRRTRRLRRDVSVDVTKDIAIGAHLGRDEIYLAAAPANLSTRAHLNGKLSSPLILRHAADSQLFEQLLHDDKPSPSRWNVVALWDFSAQPQSVIIQDSSGHGRHAVAVQMPTRAVTGPSWNGQVLDHTQCPEHYDAIHFHEDDLEDAGWAPSLELKIPDGWSSGIYAICLTDGQSEEQIPFYVRPVAPIAPILFLAPTNTYLAYGNERTGNDDAGDALQGMRDTAGVPDPLDGYLNAHPELGLSLYDRHTDGTGACYSSRLRPILNWRPGYRTWLNNAPRNFAADFYLVDWLTHHGFPYDVATDEDLHREGAALLAEYKVVLTGTHPEYVSESMLDALTTYVEDGGRLMYLGGNGFYWVTSYHTERPHVIEVRRGFTGNGTFRSPVGEGAHSTTGEPGGIWRLRGRAPNSLVGVGYTANGWARGSGYRRAGGDRYGWIFDGIERDDVIGDFGLMLGAAAGDEIDCADVALGTPPQTVVLATTVGHSDYYQPVIEDYSVFLPNQGGTRNPRVRADITLYETGRGGGVFSVGSISWCGSLPHNGYKNNVSQLTYNALTGLLSRDKLKSVEDHAEV